MIQSIIKTLELINFEIPRSVLNSFLLSQCSQPNTEKNVCRFLRTLSNHNDPPPPIGVVIACLTASARDGSLRLMNWAWEQFIKHKTVDRNLCLQAWMLRLSAYFQSGNIEQAITLVTFASSPRCGFYEEGLCLDMLARNLKKSKRQTDRAIDALADIASTGYGYPIFTDWECSPDIESLPFKFSDEHQNLQVTTEALNLVVRACSYAREIAQASFTYDRTQEFGVEPNINTYNSILLGCERSRWYPKAKHVFSTMSVEPDQETIAHMSTLFAEIGDDESLLKLVSAYRHFIRPSSFDRLIELLVDNEISKIGTINQVLEIMKETGLRPSYKSMESVKKNMTQVRMEQETVDAEIPSSTMPAEQTLQEAQNQLTEPSSCQSAI